MRELMAAVDEWRRAEALEDAETYYQMHGGDSQDPDKPKLKPYVPFAVDRARVRKRQASGDHHRPKVKEQGDLFGAGSQGSI